MGRTNKETLKDKKTKKEPFSMKKYLRDFLIFADKRLIKTTGILLIVSIILIALALGTYVTIAKSDECLGTCRDNVQFVAEFGSKLGELIVTVFAGIVPRIYIPIIGFVGLVLGETATMAYAIKGYGYFGGVMASLIPVLLNLITIGICTSLGIYVCRMITIDNKLTNMNSMSWLDCRVQVYDMLKKEEKAKALKKRKEEKINKLKSQKEKINYLQIINTLIVVSIIQFISVVIQHIVL